MDPCVQTASNLVSDPRVSVWLQRLNIHHHLQLHTMIRISFYDLYSKDWKSYHLQFLTINQNFLVTFGDWFLFFCDFCFCFSFRWGMIKTLKLGIAAENELECLGRRFFVMSCRPKIDHPSSSPLNFAMPNILMCCTTKIVSTTHHHLWKDSSDKVDSLKLVWVGQL